MVTGIVVDTFASLREETEARFETLQNECFISGITREQYDEKGLDFEALKERDQNLWNYLYFVMYLRQKDPNEYNGVEQYVADCLENENTSWFPARTSAAMESAGAIEVRDGERMCCLRLTIFIQAETTVDDRLQGIDSRMAALENLVGRLLMAVERK